MPFGFFPFAPPFGFPLLFNPFFALPIGLLAGTYDQVIFPGFVTFPPGGVI